MEQKSDSPRLTHWRRHNWQTAAGKRGNTVTATACGRLVDLGESHADPTEADCPECIDISFRLALKGFYIDGVDTRGRR